MCITASSAHYAVLAPCCRRSATYLVSLRWETPPDSTQPSHHFSTRHMLTTATLKQDGCCIGQPYFANVSVPNHSSSTITNFAHNWSYHTISLKVSLRAVFRWSASLSHVCFLNFEVSCHLLVLLGFSSLARVLDVGAKFWGASLMQRPWSMIIQLFPMTLTSGATVNINDSFSHNTDVPLPQICVLRCIYEQSFSNLRVHYTVQLQTSPLNRSNHTLPAETITIQIQFRKCQQKTYNYNDDTAATAVAVSLTSGVKYIYSQTSRA